MRDTKRSRNACSRAPVRIAERIAPMSVNDLRNKYALPLHWPWLLTPEPGPFVWRPISPGIYWHPPGYIHCRSSLLFSCRAIGSDWRGPSALRFSWRSTLPFGKPHRLLRQIKPRTSWLHTLTLALAPWPRQPSSLGQSGAALLAAAQSRAGLYKPRGSAR
jgi:hypothetical protein